MLFNAVGAINSQGVSTPTPPTPILDTVTGSVAAYSLRLLRSAYSGNSIRVRRSNDNAEADIGFDVNGDLDTSALSSHVGSNSGYVVKWYDQSGNTNDASQSTTGNQPLIVNSGTYLGAIYFNQKVLQSPSISQSQPYSINAIVQPKVEVTGYKTFLRTSSVPSNFDMLCNLDTVSKFRVNAGSGYYLGAYSANSKNIITFSPDSTNSTAYQNGTEYTGNGGTNNINTNLSIGGDTGTLANGLEHNLYEVILFSSALSTSNRQTLESNQGTYYGITVA
jgi:hypothetical protein